MYHRKKHRNNFNNFKDVRDDIFNSETLSHKHIMKKREKTVFWIISLLTKASSMKKTLIYIFIIIIIQTTEIRFSYSKDYRISSANLLNYHLTRLNSFLCTDFFFVFFLSLHTLLFEFPHLLFQLLY